jgi:precorrin-8X/cobalt-precorrin-8 methylmutase
VVLRELLAAHGSGRTLIGIDVALGYPVGTADAFGLADPIGEPPWRRMWTALAAAIVDDDRNRNNRFEVAARLNRAAGPGAGPFWGRPAGSWVDGLEATKPATTRRSPPAELRATELALRAVGRRPMSVWQLMGAGSVGSQTLTAIPVLERLVADGGGRVRVWPFATGLAAPATQPGDVVVAEVWPTAFDPPMPPGTVRDAAQVCHVAVALAAADGDGRLRSWFTPRPADAATVVAEEGWVLGPVERPLLP